jgi:hypothetical protein
MVSTTPMRHAALSTRHVSLRRCEQLAEALSLLGSDTASAAERVRARAVALQAARDLWDSVLADHVDEPTKSGGLDAMVEVVDEAMRLRRRGVAVTLAGIILLGVEGMAQASRSAYTRSAA